MKIYCKIYNFCIWKPLKNINIALHIFQFNKIHSRMSHLKKMPKYMYLFHPHFHLAWNTFWNIFQFQKYISFTPYNIYVFFIFFICLYGYCPLWKPGNPPLNKKKRKRKEKAIATFSLILTFSHNFIFLGVFILCYKLAIPNKVTILRNKVRIVR